MNISLKILPLIIFSALISTTVFSQTYTNFTTNDISGNEITLDSLLKKGPVFLSFWSTWNEPSKKAMKFLQPLYEKYKDHGFTFLAVSEDNQKSAFQVEPFINSHRYTFPVILDTDRAILDAYKVSEMPYSLLINPNHEFVSVYTGFQHGDDKKIEEEIGNLFLKR